MLDFADRTGSSIFMEVWPQITYHFVTALYTQKFSPKRHIHNAYARLNHEKNFASRRAPSSLPSQSLPGRSRFTHPGPFTPGRQPECTTHTKLAAGSAAPPVLKVTHPHHAGNLPGEPQMSNKGITLTQLYGRATHHLPTFHLQQAPSIPLEEKWTRARPTMEGRERCAMEHKSREHELNLSRS